MTGDAEKYGRGGVEGWLLWRFRRRLLEAVGPVGEGRVLDAGCGEGFVAAWLRKAHPRARIVGVDRCPEAIASAATRVPGAAFREGDVHRLPFAEGEFDVVVCTEVLEHVEDPSAVLSELRRVARRRLVVTVPHEPFFRAGNLLRARHVRRGGSTPGHRWTWTAAGFRRLVGEDAQWFGAFPWQGATVRLSGR